MHVNRKHAQVVRARRRDFQPACIPPHFCVLVAPASLPTTLAVSSPQNSSTLSPLPTCFVPLSFGLKQVPEPCVMGGEHLHSRKGTGSKKPYKARAVAHPYDTPFTRETEPWGARAFVTVQPRHPDIPAAAFQSTRKPSRKRQPLTLSVVSYNVLADSNSARVQNCAQLVTNWGRRREILLKEIFSVR